MSKTSENIINKIDASKEVLGTLPKNNKRNIDSYLEKIEELQREHKKIEKNLLDEMKRRYEEVIDIKENEEISVIKQALNNTEGILYLLNEIDTSYEKMDLDRAIHNLSFFYKRNLEIVNENILYCIRKFKEVGIDIKIEDIPYSKYAKEYLAIFFDEFEDKEMYSKLLNRKFEEIYWQCPNIITHIQLNIRYLYLINEKAIDKYYENQKEKLLKKFTKENIIEREKELKMQLESLIKKEKKGIIEGFINGEISLKDYNKATMNAKYTKFIGKEALEEADNNKLNEMELILEKLSNSVYEYKKYLEFKFIIEDIKKIYSDRDKYKKVYMQTKKEISVLEKKIIKLDKIINGTGIFKKTDDKYVVEQDNLILELKKLYKQLDKDKVYNKIATQLNDNSTIADILNLASSFYNYLFECVKSNYQEILEDGIDEFIQELREFVRWPYCTMINNIKIQEDKDLLIIIKDRYQLLNINITKDDLAPDNLDILISIMDSININHNIRRNNIDIDELGNIYEFKKILDKQ